MIGLTSGQEDVRHRLFLGIHEVGERFVRMENAEVRLRELASEDISECQGIPRSLPPNT